jgi:predicted transglutaminase-like cysteine proteinase
MLRCTPLCASALSAMALAMCTAPAAHAAMSAAIMPQAIAVASLSSAMPCAIAGAGIPTSVQPVASLSQAKSAAILGGKLSKLDQIRLSQSAQPPDQTALAPATLRVSAPLQPNLFGQACDSVGPAPSGTSFIQRTVQPRTMGSGDFLASKRLKISRPTFDPEWNRVQRRALGRATVAKYLGSSTQGASEATLAKVNAWTNQRVRYVEDRDLYGLGDCSHAVARETPL